MPTILSSRFKESFIVFFCAWIFFGLTINKSDLKAYTLQQAVVEAIVQYNTFQLGFSKLERLRPSKDIVNFNGNNVAAKQPGQFVFSALPYYVLYRLGISYQHHYVLTSRLVTWLSASFISALAVLFLFLLLSYVWKFHKYIAYLTASSYAFATIIYPYSSIAHHDIIAVSMLLIAFYFIEKNIHLYLNKNDVLAFFSGVFLGFAIFSSMLPALIVLMLLIYIYSFKNWKNIILSGFGFFVGLFPLFLYNIYYFGNPLLQANMAGNYKDTFFKLDLIGFPYRFNLYFLSGDLSILKYMPIIALAFLGILFMGSKFKREKILILLSILVHVFYIFNIPAIGYCQFGPRFLIPLIPFMMMGLPFLLTAESIRRLRPVVLFIVIPVIIYSFAVNLLGSLIGTMYCNTKKFALLVYIKQLWPDNIVLLTVWILSVSLGFIISSAFAIKFQLERMIYKDGELKL